MITKLVWDSTFFRKKIGSMEHAPRSASELSKALSGASRSRYDYLVCKLDSPSSSAVRLLEQAGFYLTDVGAVWTFDLRENAGQRTTKRHAVRHATEEDIPKLHRIGAALFLDSRFYHDPFFSRKDADRLFLAWIENSVRGAAADAVFLVPRAGFVTCRLTGKHRGDIGLIGVRFARQGRGVGTALIQEALSWFQAQGATTVHVRTQIRNIRSMNFYASQGFIIHHTDMVFGKIMR